MISKEEAKQKVEKLVEEFQSIPKDDLNKKSEFQIQTEFIDPLFEALGWDMRKDAERERKIFGKRADYVMHLRNQEVAIIEAKKASIRLGDEKEGEQAVSYAYHQKIKFAVLTNFKQIRVYHALNHTTKIQGNLLKDKTGYLWINCENFVEEFDRLWLLSKESFEKEEINKLLENVNKRSIKPIDESILADLLEIRRILSSDLKSRRTYLSSEQIDEAVQILIDRLIFMRSAEDRGLELEDFLLKIMKKVQEGYEDSNLWVVLKAQFKRFDKTYNSKLFAEGVLEKDDVFFDQKTLVKTIKAIYYGTADNQARYKFNILPVDLLGSIYEQYLGVVLRGTEKRVKLDLQSGKRKKMGIYYTPSYIVEYIVKNTIGEYCKNKSLDEILNIKIVDPACGSGSFLIRAFQELINIVEEKLKKGEKSKEYSLFQSWNGKLNLGEKKQILLNCIYGVDLDEKAVELARLNLLLKCLEEETRETKSKRLPNLSENIRNGNSLISDSRYDKAFNWNAQFGDVFRDGGFDVVVGNPPYVRVQELKHKDIDYFKENFQTAFKRVDVSLLFFERALTILKENGRLGFISSNQFLVSTYGEKLREFLLQNRMIDIVDFGDLPVFNEALTYTSIFIISKSKPANFNYAKIKNLLDFSNKKYSIENINISSLNKEPWNLGGKEVLSIVDKLNSIKTKLSDIAQTNYGIITGNDNLLILQKENLNNLKFNERFVKKIINPQDINRYCLEEPKNRVIYPYAQEANSTKLEKLNEIKTKDTNLYNYLMKNKSKLESRKDSRGNFKESPRWYGLVRFSRLDIFNQDKILTPSIVKKNKFCLDNNYYAFSGGKVTCITSNQDLLVLLGILNSKLIEFYLHQICPLKSGGYFNYSNTFLSKIPIKIPSEKQSAKIKELVERIMEFYKDGKSEQDIKNVDYEIDEEVYKLYGLTKDEIGVVEGSLG